MQSIVRLLRRRNPSLPKDFDDGEYLRLNPDVASLWKGRGRTHWLRHGHAEGRVWAVEGNEADIPLDFDDFAYETNNPDAQIAMRAIGLSAREHWIVHGRREGRRGWSVVKPSLLPLDFDEISYLMDHPSVAADVRNSVFESAASFLTYKEMRKHASRPPPDATQSGEPAADDRPDVLSPSDLLRGGFDAAAYGSRNPDVWRSTGGDPLGLADHWLRRGYAEGRTPYGVNPYFKRRIGPDFRTRKAAVTVFGFFDAKSGLGTAARNYRDALMSAGLDVRTVLVTGVRFGFETSPDLRSAAMGEAGYEPTRVNIFLLNADMIHRFFLDDRLHLLNDSFNIGVWYWELAHFRPDWVSAFGALDELWVSSEFVRRSVASLSPIPVHIVPQTIALDGPAAPHPRARFRIAESLFVVGCIFDVGSVVDRKNPQALIKAFRALFGDRKDVLLVLKYHSAHHYPLEIRKLHELASGAPNIRFFGQEFDDKDNVAFKAALDCYASPHRSEGFGLNVAEAMLLGKPVIATDYGGSVDFLSEDTGYPVRFRLTEIGRQVGPYPAGALWAEPSVDHLQERLREVFEDRAGRETRAERGRRTIVERFGATVASGAIAAHFERLQVLKASATVTAPMRSGVALAYGSTKVEGTLFSILVPVYDVDVDLLEKCVRSVVDQTYAPWELILHDDGSTRPDTLAYLRTLRGTDARIKVSFGTKNQGIAGATNEALALTSGSFVALLDNDDELAPEALGEMAKAIEIDPDVDLLYSDEDKIEPDGRFSDHYFKPDWSPEHLESVMYLLHFLVIRRSVLLDLGGFRAAYSGAQDYDLALRASRVARKIAHVPSVLYHWRKIEGSASATLEAKPVALERARLALADHIEASGRGASVEEGLATGLFRVRDTLKADLPVTLVIFTDNRTKDVPKRGRINLFDHFFESILRKTKTRCDVRFLVVDNGNLSGTQRSRIARSRGTVVSFEAAGPFNFSRKANFALGHVATDLFVLLNDDMEVIRPDWLDALLEFAQRPAIGVVGARLLFPDNSIQHCGIVLGIKNNVAHVYHRQMADGIGYNGFTHVVRNYLAVTGACLATRLNIIDEVGPFDEKLAIDYNDVDFCLRVYSAGYRNVYTPFAELYHFENMTVTRAAAAPAEWRLFRERWGHLLANDPYYNPNLSRQTADFAPARPGQYR